LGAAILQWGQPIFAVDKTVVACNFCQTELTTARRFPR
jgi:hypothetical protein